MRGGVHACAVRTGRVQRGQGEKSLTPVRQDGGQSAIQWLWLLRPVLKWGERMGPGRHLVDEAVAVGVKSAEHRRHFLEGGAGKELLPARRIGMRCRPRWQCGSTGANGGGGVRRADNEGHGAGGGTPDSPSSVEPLQVFVRAGKGLGRSGSSRHPRQRQDLGRGDAGSRVFLEHAVDELAGRAGRPGPLAGVATPVSAEGGLAGSDAQPLLSGRGRADGIERQGGRAGGRDKEASASARRGLCWVVREPQEAEAWAACARQGVERVWLLKKRACDMPWSSMGRGGWARARRRDLHRGRVRASHNRLQAGCGRAAGPRCEGEEQATGEKSGGRRSRGSGRASKSGTAKMGGDREGR
eukprot:scaffold19167_cov111-Isochrysis_galbana.AAC.3